MQLSLFFLNVYAIEDHYKGLYANDLKSLSTQYKMSYQMSSDLSGLPLIEMIALAPLDELGQDFEVLESIKTVFETYQI